MTARRHRRWREEVNSGNLFLQIWQLREATFNQQLGSLPTKSRAKILPRCGWDYPLPPPINRGGFDGLREEKIGSKNHQKSAFSTQFSCNRSFLFFLSPPWPLATTTLITGLSTTSFTTRSHQPTTDNHREVFPLPLQIFFFYSSSFFLRHKQRTPLPFLPLAPSPSSCQTNDNSFFSSARLPPTSLRRLQLQSCMQNVNLLFTFCN